MVNLLAEDTFKSFSLTIDVQSLLIVHVHREGMGISAGWTQPICLRAGQVMFCISSYCVPLHDYQVLAGDKLLWLKIKAKQETPAYSIYHGFRWWLTVKSSMLIMQASATFASKGIISFL